MKKNELPEDVKRKIEEQVNFALPDAQWSGYARNQFRQAVEIGYRLGLQFRDEQLNELRKIQSGTINDLNRWIENCRGAEEQLKAKDEENQRLREALDRAYNHHTVARDYEIESLLSQSTDKP